MPVTDRVLRVAAKRCQAVRFTSVLAVLASIGSALAQGGPPFRTDDPETPGNNRWEINFGFLGERNPAEGSYQTPDVDLNYGLGDRIQLKYEIPIAIEETRTRPGAPMSLEQPGKVIGGIGQSLLGIKWRFYEHHPGERFSHNDLGTGLFGMLHPSRSTTKAGKSVGGADYNLNSSIYPQLYLDNPTRSVPRGVVDAGPNFYLPLEVNGRFGPIRYAAEMGYNFGNRASPQSWNRGLIVGHEFTERMELYVELYDQQDTNRVPATGHPVEAAENSRKQRETTLDIGGRRSLNKRKSMNLLLMVGRSFQAVTPENSQPSWIAYVGFQVLLGAREPITPQVEQKLPDDSEYP